MEKIGQSDELISLYAAARMATKEGNEIIATKNYEQILKTEPTSSGLHSIQVYFRPFL